MYSILLYLGMRCETAAWLQEPKTLCLIDAQRALLLLGSWWEVCCPSRGWGKVVLQAGLSDVSFGATACRAHTVGLWDKTTGKSQVTVSLQQHFAALQVLGVILCPNQGNDQSSQCWNRLVSRVEKSDV